MHAHLKKYAKRKGTFLFSGIAIVIIFFLYKGCSNESAAQKPSTYRIARGESWPAANLMGKEKNFAAFIDDLFAKIAEDENIKISVFPTTTNSMQGKLLSGQIDGMISNLQPDTTNEQTLLFSSPFFIYGPVLVVPVTSELDTKEELNSRIIGMLSQDPQVLEITKDNTIQIKLYNNVFKALTDLSEKHIDGLILSALPAFIYTRTFYPGKLKIVTGPLNSEGIRLVVQKNEKGEVLIEKFNEGFQKLRADGSFEKLLSKWDIINPEKIHAEFR